MNWRQLYNASEPEERLDLLLAMLRRIEARPMPIILAGGRLRRDRRRERVAHFIRERRGRYPIRVMQRLAFLSTLGLLFMSLWLVALNLPHHVAAPLVFFYNLLLIGFLLIKPSAIHLALLKRKTEQ